LSKLLKATLLLTVLAVVASAAETLADLLAAAKRVGGVVLLENEYVRVHGTILEYPRAPRRAAEERPIVLYVRLGSDEATSKTRLLEPPHRARLSWRPGVLPVGVWIELLKPPPKVSSLGDPGTYPPRDAIEEDGWGGGTLILATFQPFHYGEGLGPLPNVTVFLSDGVVEVASQGLRRRMGVQAGNAFWFEARTRLTVIDDYTVGAAILQLPTRR
jgi:hypothetical protein